MERIGQKIYDSSSWRKLRQAYMASQHGLCERCGYPGDVVHHIEPITADNVNDPFVTFGWDNLELLCHACHNQEHNKIHLPVRDGFSFDKFGNLIETREF
ncbi:HNH endonuclease [Alkalibacillus salilacus]|uniref:5-methylcytosine-specific restriction endonuclease McrA n=1 Tax=Alkalibacillus salilacus TaxID=284582 RepID=A0ABT9VDG4_9BACI|nr:HNH endonuclease signature motif containing protein [Alkalibacillus salilacus]MDQ0158972.1 5-methylcytosine-specific restriction endonuclease McrA [Alkalibacillus salilacus]